jgi:galactokinase
MSAADLFRTAYSREPDGLFSAPGRVNLIGEHTDYTGGLVMPFAIDARAHVAAAMNRDGIVRVVSAQRPDEVIAVALQTVHPGSAVAGTWAGYLVGAIWSLRCSGFDVRGMDIALDSQVPAGAGLSSSAAIECVTALAAADLSHLTLSPMELAKVAQRAENDFAGVPCGPMDQAASAASQQGSVLLLDTRTMTTENIPFDPESQSLAVVVFDTRVAHSLADGEYGRRRASCERAAAIIGVDLLGELHIDDLGHALADLDDAELRRRVRHVVTENDRVQRTARLLRMDAIGEIGDLLTASHYSLRDDYEVSSPELDQVVSTALEVGALGARMTGGGFGGSAIALVHADRVAGTIDAVATAFDRRGFTAPVPRVVRPAQGARRDG